MAPRPIAADSSPSPSTLENDYSGALSSFGSTYTAFGTGFGDFAPIAGQASQTRVYKVTYLVGDVPNSVQGGTASIGLTWESQNSEDPRHRFQVRMLPGNRGSSRTVRW